MDVVTQKAESELLTREILYPDGKLIARGMIALTPKGSNKEDFDLKNFPLGLLECMLNDN